MDKEGKLLNEEDVIKTIHETIYSFFDISEDEDTSINEKDKLLLEVNKAISNAIKSLPSEPQPAWKMYQLLAADNLDNCIYVDTFWDKDAAYEEMLDRIADNLGAYQDENDSDEYESVEEYLEDYGNEIDMTVNISKEGASVFDVGRGDYYYWNITELTPSDII